MSITGMLKRRGFEIHSFDNPDRLIFPKFYPKRSKDRFFALLHSYSTACTFIARFLGKMVQSRREGEMGVERANILARMEELRRQSRAIDPDIKF